MIYPDQGGGRPESPEEEYYEETCDESVNLIDLAEEPPLPSPLPLPPLLHQGQGRRPVHVVLSVVSVLGVE